MFQLLQSGFFWWPVFILAALASPRRPLALSPVFVVFGRATGVLQRHHPCLWRHQGAVVGLLRLSVLVRGSARYVGPHPATAAEVLTGRPCRMLSQHRAGGAGSGHDVVEMRNSCSGNPRWQQLLDLPAARLSAEAVSYGPVEHALRMLDDDRTATWTRT